MRLTRAKAKRRQAAARQGGLRRRAVQQFYESIEDGLGELYKDLAPGSEYLGLNARPVFQSSGSGGTWRRRLWRDSSVSTIRRIRSTSSESGPSGL